ncbi:MAG: biotin--[acetyl-CoA-carboxylase] ligase [Nitrospirae bacterium]|nr:biotin--[acetyl-CoA-carboxylase] ligase [Nitrospirota bacterium]
MDLTKDGIEELILKALSTAVDRGQSRSGTPYLSGGELGRTLKISRTAVWKHIRVLQKRGYQIRGVPSKGYMLLEKADRLSRTHIEKTLQTRKIGSTLYLFEEIGSTNDHAMMMGEQGIPEGAVFLAESQTHGKGRLGRSWISPPGVNLYLSILFRPTFPPVQAPMMTLMSACAVVEAVKEVTGIDAGIKWPNDILIEGKKVSGILTEMSAEQDTVHHLVVGTGINVNMDTQSLPPDIQGKSTSLFHHLGRKTDRTELLCALLKSIERFYGVLNRKGPEAIVRCWKQHSNIVGKRVAVSTHRKTIEGRVEDLTPDGALMIRLNHGERVNIFSGDVEILS